MDIKPQNSKCYDAHSNLEVPYSLDASANAQVPLGTPIPNFPQTTLALMDMNGKSPLPLGF